MKQKLLLTIKKAVDAVNKMKISYSKNSRPPYINFRIRKLIYLFFMDNQVEMYSMNQKEKSIFVSEKIEQILCDNFWVKDKRKTEHAQLKKTA